MYSRAIPGDVVRAMAGKERGRLFYVLSESDGYLFLADGKRRKVEMPKNKKRKHAMRVCSGGVTGESIRCGCSVNNRQMRMALAAFKAGASESESEEVY